MATITVDGANDLPPDAGTSIGITGEDFPPLSVAQIAIRAPNLRAQNLHDSVDVDESGRFFWAKTVHPKLPDGASVAAVVTTADGTKVEGSGEVIGVA